MKTIPALAVAKLNLSYLSATCVLGGNLGPWVLVLAGFLIVLIGFLGYSSIAQISAIDAYDPWPSRRTSRRHKFPVPAICISGRVTLFAFLLCLLPFCVGPFRAC